MNRTIAAVITAASLIGIPAAEAGPYVQAGIYLHDSDFDEMKAHGNLDFPVVLELSAGIEHKSGWFIQATHYSNPEAADTGLNMVGGGFRYKWGK